MRTVRGNICSDVNVLHAMYPNRGNTCARLGLLLRSAEIITRVNNIPLSMGRHVGWTAQKTKTGRGAQPLVPRHLSAPRLHGLIYYPDVPWRTALPRGRRSLSAHISVNSLVPTPETRSLRLPADFTTSLYRRARSILFSNASQTRRLKVPLCSSNTVERDQAESCSGERRYDH